MIRDDTWRRIRDMDQPAECRRVRLPDIVAVPNGNPAWLKLGEGFTEVRFPRRGRSQ